jgi:hypothetical protein
VISKKAIALCATVGVAMSGFAFAIPAQAEPVAEKFAIVGSDTLEDVVSAMVNGTEASGAYVRSSSGYNNTAASFDATAPGVPGASGIITTIMTKQGLARFGRPNGSGSGKNALTAQLDGTTFGQQVYVGGATTATTTNFTVPAGAIDIVRSSSASTTAGSKFAQVPFGRDAISYVYDSASTASGIDSMTTAALLDLINCTDGALASGIKLKLPQPGSGTLSDFTKKVNGTTTATTETVLAAAANKGCVIRGQEHDASGLAANIVMPMSVSRWIAMKNGLSIAKYEATTVLGTMVAGTAPTVTVAATADAAAYIAPNPDYYANSTWGRNTVLLVDARRLDTTNTQYYDAKLANLLNPAVSTSLANMSVGGNLATGGWVKKKFGFLPIADTTKFYTN